jgi:catechol 2,3-dioxygenase-like lactoylglutathione lyase family enzyme
MGLLRDELTRSMGLHHLALRVADLERSLAFYRDRLGLSEVRREVVPGGASGSVWLAADDVLLMLETRLRGAGPEAGSGHLLAFRVDDLATWEARLSAAGIAIEDRTAHTLYLRDPDGHRVGLSAFPWPPPR